MSTSDRRFAIAAVRDLLNDPQALVESAGAARMRASAIEIEIGCVRGAANQYNQS